METVFDIESLETFSIVAEDLLDNLFNSKRMTQSVLEPHTYQMAKEDLRKLISSSNFEIAKVTEILQTKEWNRENVNHFVTLLERNKSRILYATLINHNSKYGETVTDFDWVLKLIMGTNELKTLNHPLMQLILSTTDSNGEQKKTVYDVHKDMLAALISLFENIGDTQ